mmetsp:Transcript_5870/g.19159  ORF Transcript_5870/g.19159 Transcript_5870/m.19159 type:complete len:237 (-) Transcript_5870:1794-2504(-)
MPTVFLFSRAKVCFSREMADTLNADSIATSRWKHLSSRRHLAIMMSRSSSRARFLSFGSDTRTADTHDEVWLKLSMMARTFADVRSAPALHHAELKNSGGSMCSYSPKQVSASCSAIISSGTSLKVSWDADEIDRAGPFANRLLDEEREKDARRAEFVRIMPEPALDTSGPREPRVDATLGSASPRALARAPSSDTASAIARSRLRASAAYGSPPATTYSLTKPLMRSRADVLKPI